MNSVHGHPPSVKHAPLHPRAPCHLPFQIWKQFFSWSAHLPLLSTPSPQDAVLRLWEDMAVLLVTILYKYLCVLATTSFSCWSGSLHRHVTEGFHPSSLLSSSGWGQAHVPLGGEDDRGYSMTGLGNAVPLIPDAEVLGRSGLCVTGVRKPGPPTGADLIGLGGAWAWRVLRAP